MTHGSQNIQQEGRKVEVRSEVESSPRKLEESSRGFATEANKSVSQMTHARRES